MACSSQPAPPRCLMLRPELLAVSPVVQRLLRRDVALDRRHRLVADTIAQFGSSKHPLGLPDQPPGPIRRLYPFVHHRTAGVGRKTGPECAAPRWGGLHGSGSASLVDHLRAIIGK